MEDKLCEKHHKQNENHYTWACLAQSPNPHFFNYPITLEFSMQVWSSGMKTALVLIRLFRTFKKGRWVMVSPFNAWRCNTRERLLHKYRCPGTPCPQPPLLQRNPVLCGGSSHTAPLQWDDLTQAYQCFKMAVECKYKNKREIRVHGLANGTGCWLWVALVYIAITDSTFPAQRYCSK